MIPYLLAALVFAVLVAVSNLTPSKITMAAGLIVAGALAVRLLARLLRSTLTYWPD